MLKISAFFDGLLCVAVLCFSPNPKRGVTFLKFIGFSIVLFSLESFSLMNNAMTGGGEEANSSVVYSNQDVQLYNTLQLEQRGLSMSAFEAGLKAKQAVAGELSNCDI